MLECKMISQKTRNMKAFTLVELLVVISIVSVLAALLLPALEKSLETARAVSCRNNMKQVYLSMVQYADDWRGYLPPRYMPKAAGSNSKMHHVVYLTTTYLDSTWNVWICPSDNIPSVYGIPYRRFSYAQVAGNDSHTLGSWSGVFPFNETNFSGTELTYDENWYQCFRMDMVDSMSMMEMELHSKFMTIYTVYPSTAYGEGLLGRSHVKNMTGNHVEGTGNITFVDGHIEALHLSVANYDPRGNRWPGK